MDWSVRSVGVEERRVRICWIGRLMVVFESWADDERGRRGKSRWISDVIKVVVRPYDGGDVAARDSKA